MEKWTIFEIFYQESTVILVGWLLKREERAKVCQIMTSGRKKEGLVLFR